MNLKKNPPARHGHLEGRGGRVREGAQISLFALPHHETTRPGVKRKSKGNQLGQMGCPGPWKPGVTPAVHIPVVCFSPNTQLVSQNRGPIPPKIRIGLLWFLVSQYIYTHGEVGSLANYPTKPRGVCTSTDELRGVR